MREIVRSTQFNRDVKLAKKRGKDMAKLRDLILLLAEGKPLSSSYKDHPLSGGLEAFPRRAPRVVFADAQLRLRRRPGQHRSHLGRVLPAGGHRPADGQGLR